jgi:hypothetical protein
LRRAAAAASAAASAAAATFYQANIRANNMLDIKQLVKNAGTRKLIRNMVEVSAT